ncbi:SDR family NAD(P)-dependent oxidoreductase [Sporosarcina obsidiansis]|uniref:SDR family NAD(P)-dependent oxidoreductase n=1 Tax=Sporosarcina obsidiansis TaxID=2660748 RepID=UPI0018914256|nr:SDR family oxidoreductase [Sporosarcina obsidiansis]
MNIQYDFFDKVAIITGSASGLGKEMALKFAKAGAKVTVSDIDEKKGGEVVRLITDMGAEAIFVYTDMTDEKSVTSMVKSTVETFGHVDILVNNAGTSGKSMGSPLTNVQSSDWDMTYQVNVRGVFFGCNAVYNLFKNQGYGKIINIASIAGRMGQETLPHYSASKAAVINFTQALAKEVAPFNINVNAVCPGVIYTPIYANEEIVQAYKERNPSHVDLNISSRKLFMARVEQRVAMKREQTPEDIANAVLFLSSEEAKNITGQALNVCGGSEFN